MENKNITIDFSDSHIWDDSAVGAVDKAVIKFQEKDNKVTIIGLDTSSREIFHKLAVNNNVD